MCKNGRDPRRFPRSPVIRSTKEEPNSVPAASPRLPRSTSPWPPGPTSASLPGSFLLRRNRPGAHRARPISARLEPVYLSRDVLTPVPRVLLFVTLAEPAPSGSTHASRLCRGCSHPSRHLPEQAAPSSPSLLRQVRRRRSLTSVRNNSASWRTRVQGRGRPRRAR